MTARRDETPSHRDRVIAGHRSMRRSLVFLVCLLAALTGCAAMPQVENPADFPSHATTEFFILHWRLERTGGEVTATGVAEVRVKPANRLREATVELRGVDTAGRVLSRGARLASPMAFDAAVPWPFAVRLRPTGGETQFVLTVLDVAWAEHLGGRDR